MTCSLRLQLTPLETPPATRLLRRGYSSRGELDSNIVNIGILRTYTIEHWLKGLADGNNGGVGRFFRYWGGEALYNSHQDHAVRGPLLESIGTPCVIQADIPISNLG